MQFVNGSRQTIVDIQAKEKTLIFMSVERAVVASAAQQQFEEFIEN